MVPLAQHVHAVEEVAAYSSVNTQFPTTLCPITDQTHGPMHLQNPQKFFWGDSVYPSVS